MKRSLLIGVILAWGAYALAAKELSPKLKSTPAQLKIMTFNIRHKRKESAPANQWGQRLARVLDIINKTKPDIFGLQEPVPEQLEDISKGIPSHYKWIGKSRGSSWGGFGSDEFTPLFYNSKLFNLSDHGTFIINKSSTWMVDISSTGWLPRVCTWGLFEHKKTGKKLYVYNTHLDHQFKKARVRGLKKIVKTINKKTRRSDAPIILMGDFNTPFIEPYKKITSGFVNTRDVALAKKGPAETFTGWDNKKPWTIDHILLKNIINSNVIEHRTIKERKKQYPSDHRPLLLKMKLI